MSMTDQVLTWARDGARKRLEALTAERAEILRIFPDLGKAAGLSVAARRGRPRGSSISEAMRQKYSDAAKLRWAKRKAAQAAVVAHVNDAPAIVPAPAEMEYAGV